MTIEKKNIEREAHTTGIDKKNIKKRNIFILISFICLLLVIVFSLKKSDKSEKGKKQRAEIINKQEIPPEIKDLLIEPEQPLSTSIIRVIPTMKERLRGSFTFKFRWFVNGKEIPGSGDGVLPARYSLKKNRVYCRVKAVKGETESKEKKSREFTIANSPPEVRHTPVKKFTVPGNFFHQINAFDPDGDRIEYHLLAPLGMGINLNSQTGEIRWPIPSLPEEEKEPEVQHEIIKEGESPTPRHTEIKPEPTDKTKVVILVEVRDSDGAVTRTGITLDLKRGGEIGF